MMFSKLLVRVVLFLLAVAAELLTETEIRQFMNCVNAGVNRYNYTFDISGELVLHPYEVRPINARGIDYIVTRCYIKLKNNASLGLSGNVTYGEYLAGSVLFVETEIPNIMLVGWQRRRRVTTIAKRSE